MTTPATLFPGGGVTPPLAELAGTDYAAGLWYAQQMGAGISLRTTGVALVNGTMALHPFVPRFTHTFTGIGWFHSSAAENGHNIRAGIYASTNGKPSGSPLVDSGNIATAASTGLMSAIISQTLNQGQLYWLAINADASLTGSGYNPASSAQAPFSVYGMVDPATAFGASSTLGILGFTQAAAFGALPAIGTLVDNAGAVVNWPCVLLKG